MAQRHPAATLPVHSETTPHITQCDASGRAAMPESGPSFGDRLRQFRSAAALSQEALAERSGLSRRAISDLERGLHQAPRLESVRLLADGLELSDADRRALLAAARPALLAPGLPSDVPPLGE